MLIHTTTLITATSICLIIIPPWLSQTNAFRTPISSAGHFGTSAKSQATFRLDRSMQTNQARTSDAKLVLNFGRQTIKVSFRPSG